MLRVMMRRRLAVYIQISFLFTGALYLLIGYGKPSSASWGIPYYSVDPWPAKPDAGTTPTSTTVTTPNPPLVESHVTSAAAGATQTPEATDKVSADEKGEHKEEHSKVDEGSEDKNDGGEADGEEEKPEDKEKEAASEPEATIPTPTPIATPKPTKEDLLTKARTLIPSILDPANTSIDRMACPSINATRYAHLKASRWERKHKYFFALNLRKCVDLLPRLLGSVLEAIAFLGPQHCAVSIVEGNSDDGTLEVLELLTTEFDRLGITYYLQSSTLNPADGQRIEKLAMLRAMAVEPVTGILTPETVPDMSLPSNITRIPQLPLSSSATVIFLNDVSACAEDILELAHQRVTQSADMTCAMDWTHPGPDPLFYDVWISRAINGDTFFDIPPSGSWEFSQDLFPNEPIARSRLAAGKPFQVFACWNGAVAFTAEPLVKNEVGFRSVREPECFQGEPQVFCKDFWYHGYGRIAVVPSVNLEYSDSMGRTVKGEKGFVSDWVKKEGVDDGVKGEIDWMGPPEMVKCMPTFQTQSWLPWNESLPL